MKPVLHVLGQLNRGGAERLIIDLVSHIDREAFPQHIYLLSGKRGSLDDVAREAGATLHYGTWSHRIAHDLTNVLKEHRIAILESHVHLSSAIILALASHKMQRIAFLHSTGDDHGDTLLREIYRKAMHALLRRTATDIVGISAGVLREAWSVDWQHDCAARVIPNGIDTSLFLPLVAARPIRSARPSLSCIHVGRFDPPKNHERVLAIFAAINKELGPSTLHLVGRYSTDRHVALMACAESFGVRDQVTFLGERNDVPQLLVASDLLLLPSLREGMPSVVLESVAAGTPVLASTLPGVLEIANEIDGIRCVDLEASNEEWATAARALLAQVGAPLALHQGIARSRFTVNAFCESHVRLWSRDWLR